MKFGDCPRACVVRLRPGVADGCFGCQPVEAGVIAVEGVFLGVERPYPQAGGPGQLAFVDGEGVTAGLAVSGQEAVDLVVGSFGQGFAGGGVDGCGEADDGGFGPGSDAVPIVDGMELLPDPAQVVCFPVHMPNDIGRGGIGQAGTDAPAEVVEPPRAGMRVEIGVAIVGNGPDAGLAVVPSRPGRRGLDAGQLCWRGRAGKQSGERRSVQLGGVRCGGQRLAARHIPFSGRTQRA